MSYITWHEKFSVGVQAFDKDHMVLLDLINQLHDAYAADKGLEAMDFCFKTLMDYTKGHLKDEEILMEEHNYPGLKEHKAAHEKMKRDLTDLHTRYLETEDENICLELLGYLTNWWHFHILEVDKAYEDFFRKKHVS